MKGEDCQIQSSILIIHLYFYSFNKDQVQRSQRGQSKRSLQCGCKSMGTMFGQFKASQLISINGQLQINSLELLLIQYISCQSSMARIQHLLLSLTFLYTLTQQYFCASSCIDFKNTCNNETSAGCTVCANNIYSLNGNVTAATPCSLLAQRTIVANDLPNTPSMSLTGFTSSKNTPVTCTNYTFSGQYTNSDYLFKNYTGIALNHHAIVVRFSVGYIGTWQQTDYLRVSLADSYQGLNFDYHYYCSSGGIDNTTNLTIHDLVQNINGEGVGVNSSDCVRIREYTIVHNTSYLALNFTALTSQSDPSVQFWGIKEIIIATKDCHPNCLTCFGALNSQCLTCAANFYLQGNICLPACDVNLYVVTDARICVAQCPTRYYAFLNTTSVPNYKQCLNCPSGCSICSDYSTCQAWDNQEAHIPNLWKDKMQFWIFLIILLCSAIVFALYKVIKKPQASEMQENMLSKSQDKDSGEKDKSQQVNESRISGQQQMNNDSMADQLVPKVDIIGGDTLWFNELVELEPQQLKVKGRRKRAKHEEGAMVNSHFDVHSNMNL